MDLSVTPARSYTDYLTEYLRVSAYESAAVRNDLLPEPAAYNTTPVNSEIGSLIDIFA